VSSDIAALFTEHRGSLVDYAAGIVGSRTQAEDLVQEAWLRFDEAARQQFLKEPLSYLYRIVRNLALDGQRRIALEKRIFSSGADAVVAAFPDARPSAEMVALHKDDLRRLREALAELPDRTRIAFEMHRLGGCKLREIAAVLKISTPMAQLLVMDGLQHCKHRLGWP
jgi:RNA polymerase sigma-70 factor (ECF subfamily)